MLFKAPLEDRIARHRTHKTQYWCAPPRSPIVDLQGWSVNSGARSCEDRETGDLHDMEKHLRQLMFGSVGVRELATRCAAKSNHSIRTGQVEIS